MTPQQVDDESLALAGTHDRAVLVASLVDPGLVVAQPREPIPGLAEALTRRHASLVDHGDPADLAIVALGDRLPTTDRLVMVAEVPDSSANSPVPVRVTDAVTTLRSAGLEARLVQRCFEQPATGADDVERWVRWFAILATRPGVAVPKAPRPDQPAARSVLLLAHEPFNRWPEARRRAVVAIHGQLAERRVTTVLSWLPRRLTGSLTAHHDLTRAGIVLHGGDGVFDEADMPREVVAPDATALICGHDPEVVVVLDAERVDETLAIGASLSARTVVLGLNLRGELVDRSTGLTGLADHILDEIDRDTTPSPPRRLDVVARPRTTGLVSVVIPVHGRWDLTEACLTSIRRHTAEPVEVIVVDNASPDETGQRLAQESDVTVVTAPTNLGFAGGTNAGIAVAAGEFVCLLNNDTEVVEGWLGRLLEALGIDGTGIAGPRSNRISGLQAIQGAPGMEDPHVREWGRAAAAHGGDRTWLTSRLVGFCMLLRGDLLEKIGGLDEGVGVGNFEDDDLCQRVQDKGLTLRVADGAVVLHHGSATFASSGISVLQTMRHGARHVGDRLQPASDLIVARVEATDDPLEVEEAVRHARLIADQIVVVCPGPRLPHALRCMKVDPNGVRVVGTETLVSTKAPWVLHLSAHHRIDARDWGATRAAVEALPRRAHAIPSLPGALLEPTRDGLVLPPSDDPTGLPSTEAILSA